jgi:hypothetical protein
MLNDPGAFEAAEQQGVHLLIADRLNRASGASGGLRAGSFAMFDSALRQAAATEPLREREMRTVLEDFSAAGVRPLLFKGAALAFTHYTSSVLRPRADVDVLVRSGEVPLACSVLERRGYRRPPFVTGEFVSSQVPYIKSDAFGVQHTYDVHWKISVPQVFANMFDGPELLAASIAVRTLGKVRSPAPVHALAIACIHRVAHHHGRDRLIWLYDIHLLAERLRPAEVDQFIDLATRKRMSAVCHRSLALAQQKFATMLPAPLLEALREVETKSEREPSAKFLRPDLRKVDVLLSDVAALQGWRARVRLLKEHVFPPAAYMREAYGVSGRGWLPALYVWRFAAGTRRWLRAPAGAVKSGDV